MRKSLIAMLTLMLFSRTSSASSSVMQDSLCYPVCEQPSTDAEINDLIIHYKYSQAETILKKKITAANRKKESTFAYEKALCICHKGNAGLKGTDDVIILDSMIVNKSSFLTAYPASCSDKLLLTDNGSKMAYKSEIGNMVIFPSNVMLEDSTICQRLMKGYEEGGKYIDAQVIEGLNVDGTQNYPYFMPDGQTFYFAAKSTDGYGNYDIYVTRYDSDSKAFYRADNIGYPYNSYANDYMMVIDEVNNIGWFASDRYQPSDKVCIYVFVPNKSRHTIDYENTDIEQVRSKATLSSISTLIKNLSDSEIQEYKEARNRLSSIVIDSEQVVRHEFEFILNDDLTIHSLSELSTDQAKTLCKEWIQKNKNLASLKGQLMAMRDNYNANKSTKNQILNLESRTAELAKEVHKIEKQIRKAELSK